MATTPIDHNKEETLFSVELNERLSAILEGLCAFYPLDGRGGTIDVISGDTTYDNIDNGVNILDALNIDWRDPSNWINVSGRVIPPVYNEEEDSLLFDYLSGWQLNIFIPVNTNKKLIGEISVKKDNSNGVFCGILEYDNNKNYLNSGLVGYFDDSFIVNNNTGTTNGVYKTFKNTEINGNPKTGESATPNVSKYPIGTKYIKFEIYFNSGNKKQSVKNLKLYYTDSDTSSVLIEDKGIAIQETTTNLCYNLSGVSSTTLLSTTPKGERLIVSRGNNGGGELARGTCNALTNGQIYTASCMVRTKDISQIYFQVFNQGILPTGDIKIRQEEDGYYWIAISFTASISNTRVSVSCINPGSKDRVEIHSFQIEQRAFPTAFVGYNLTKNKGALQINIPQVIQNSATPFPFTVTCDCEYMLNDGQNGGQTFPGSENILSLISWYLYAGGGGGTEKGTSNFIVRTTSELARKKFRVTLILRSTNYSMYIDEVIIITNEAYVNGLLPPLDIPITFGARGINWNTIENLPLMNAWCSNVAFYNRELSLAEITQLSNTKTQLSPTNYIARSFNEKPQAQKYFHFPLGVNTNDITNTILAVSSINLAYEEGAVFVGTPTTNLLFNSGQSMSNIVSAYGAGVKSNKTTIDRDTAYFNVFQPTDVLRVYCNLSDLTYGQFYTSSVRAEKLQNIGITWNDVSGQVYENNNIIKITSDQSSGGLYNDTYRFSDIYLPEARVYRLSNAQVEQKPFRTPFVWGTRGAGILTYNLNRDLGLDWNAEWTICYWKKAMGTHTDDFNGQNIDIIGGGILGNFIIYGKDNGSNLYVYTEEGGAQFNVLGTATPEYYSKWYFVSLVKVGTIITVRFDYIDNSSLVTTIDIGVITSNHFVNAYGADFQLGGSENSDPTNTFFRDLVVAKYALSDLELQNIKSSFNVDNDENYINLIKEI